MFEKIVGGKADANVDFADLCHLLRQIGFTERTKGSHHVFKKPDIPAIVLQSDGAKAKTYQVRQVRDIFKKFNIEVKP